MTREALIIVPGKGIGAAVVGRSTAEEICAAFGTDCKVSRHDPSGEIFSVDYDYENDDDYAADRPEQASRPGEFTFDFSLLSSIAIGVYQTELRTRGGIGIDSPIDDVTRAFGPPEVVLHEEKLDLLRYLSAGLEVTVDKSDMLVSALTIFRARAR